MKVHSVAAPLGISLPMTELKTRIPAKLCLSAALAARLALSTVCALAQVPKSSPPAASSGPVERGIDLAAKGRCDEALPLLKELGAISDKQLKYQGQMATAHCAIKRRDGQLTVATLMALRHEYPKDPEVLYLTTQVFLEIAVRASQELTALAPDSIQVLELQAETLESQSKLP